MLTPAQTSVLLAAFGALADRPRLIAPLLTALAGDGQAPDDSALSGHVRTAEQTDPVVNRLRYLLVSWDACDADWAAGTGRNSLQRRQRIYDSLGASVSLRAVLNERLPFAPWQPAVIISNEFKRWYTEDVRARQNFYWRHYKQYLLTRLDPGVVQKLDENTTLVVERLAEPQRPDAYQAKGLVVGYVQSGKTANFTGVIAKAIDAGYRLVVVLSGLTDLLRNQTQRRLDMELVGKEQIRPADEVDPSFDYFTDPHWSRFISYGERPVDLGGVKIVRLTGAGSGGEFRSLQHGIQSLEIEKRVRHLPVYDAANLPYAGARLLVIKKHPTIIGKFIKNMRRVGLSLFADVPALVIDDESDQASVNTIDPSKSDRVTATNAQIRELLKVLPRAQYVGYTATPFANVFISPTQAEDLFPKDFLLSLPRPQDYIGVSYFHDLERTFDDGERTVANSNELAFVRNIPDRNDATPDRLQHAIDAFVLSGALKLYRVRHGATLDALHHTMLVHSSSLQKDQSGTATELRALWRRAGYDGGEGIRRVRLLFESDFLPVSRARAPGLPTPNSLDELSGDIAEAINRIDGDEGPVYIVNGSDEADDPDFDLRPVWKILVGGAKLSRGYTVEGLTISHFRRRSTVQDTLLQMGRWFGFRRGYHDLLRLYIGRSEVLDRSQKKTLDLYLAFEAICRDEEAFRTQLSTYALPTDGREPITPKQIPPVVFSSHPQLQPAPKNKMFNAELVAANFGGNWIEKTGLVEKHLEHNEALFRGLIEEFAPRTATLVSKVTGHGEAAMDAKWLLVPHKEMLRVLREMHWTQTTTMRLELDYLAGKFCDPAVDNWVLMLPQIVKQKGKWMSQFACVERKWTDSATGGRFMAFSDPQHRLIAESLSGVHKIAEMNEPASRLAAKRRGALLLYPTKKRDQPENNTPFMGIAILPPPNGSPIKTQFRVRVPGAADEAVVDVPAPASKRPRK